ncbi:hypothetical protein ACVR0S_01345 [Streptococcus dentapri]|uniref:Uncharacterized protein n=1 Tax=Streptococcus dentapri TaxID=573564 RepID=A0ABV8D0Z9_9STRE
MILLCPKEKPPTKLTAKNLGRRLVGVPSISDTFSGAAGTFSALGFHFYYHSTIL